MRLMVIVQLHLAGFNSDAEELYDNKKSYVVVDTGGSESPSLVAGGNSELGQPDDIASTLHHIGVLCGYDNNSIYMPSLAEVFDSIDQDHLYAHDSDDELTVNEEMLAFLGMFFSF